MPVACVTLAVLSTWKSETVHTELKQFVRDLRSRDNPQKLINRNPLESGSVGCALLVELTFTMAIAKVWPYNLH